MIDLKDEKRMLLAPILSQLRFYNPGIGAYEQSELKDDLNYHVKLDNGQIEICSDLVKDSEPGLIYQQKLIAASTTFSPHGDYGHEVFLKESNMIESRRNLKRFFYAIMFLMVAAAIYFMIKEISAKG